MGLGFSSKLKILYSFIMLVSRQKKNTPSRAQVSVEDNELLVCYLFLVLDIISPFDLYYQYSRRPELSTSQSRICANLNMQRKSKM